MASIKMAGGSVMDVVTSISGTVISTANTITQTVGWAESAMTQIRAKQAIDQKIEMVDYTEKSIMKHSHEHAKLMKNIRSDVGNDNKKAEDFNKHQENLRKALGLKEEA